jgi:hypothetical protein
VRVLTFNALILGIVLSMFPAGLLLAEEQSSSAKAIEILVQGKKYKSIREYKREQIKAAFEGILSSRDFEEFGEDELTAIIKEICDEHDHGTAQGLDLPED